MKARRKPFPPEPSVTPDSVYWSIVDDNRPPPPKRHPCDKCGRFTGDLRGVSSGVKVIPEGEAWCLGCVHEAVKKGLD